jgi:hypothetical protein
MGSNRDGYGLTRHQQHVTAHVAGCELLGYGYLKNEALFVLDIPFIWSIAIDGSMDLGSSDDMSSRLELDDDDRSRLSEQSQSLRDGAVEDFDINIFSESTSGLRVDSVTCKAETDSHVDTIIVCDGGNVIVTSVNGYIQIDIQR